MFNTFGQWSVSVVFISRHKQSVKAELATDAKVMRDMPQERLKRGDIVKLVGHHVARDGEDGCSAEVFNAVGDTLAVITMLESAFEPPREHEVCCVRALE